MTLSGQVLEKHQWKERVLLVISDDKNAVDFTNQIKILKEKPSELKDRKLIVYQVTKEEYTFNGKWVLSRKLFQKYNKKSHNFKVILIGLDGGIKLQQSKILSPEKLFTVIDGMPMRKQELKYR